MLFFFNDTATTEIYTLSLHDALPICVSPSNAVSPCWGDMSSQDSAAFGCVALKSQVATATLELILSELVEEAHLERSEEHTSELQSRQYLVCRLLLEKK